LLKPASAEGLAVDRDIIETYREMQLRDIVVEIHIPLFRANSPGLTPEGRCLSPGKGNFRNGRCVASYVSLLGGMFTVGALSK